MIPASTSAVVRWSYGAAPERIASGPSADAAGNLYVFVVRLTSDLGRHGGAALVVLDRTGHELRRTSILAPEAKPTADPPNRWAVRPPIVDAAGGAWVVLHSEVVRVTPSGAVAWRAPFPADAPGVPRGNTFYPSDLCCAAAGDGTLFVATTGYLLALSPAGKWLWQSTRGPRPRAEGAPLPTKVGAPAVGVDGVVLATCVGCFHGKPTQAGIAAFDPRDGAPKWMVGIEEKKGDEGLAFGSPALDGAGNVVAPAGFGVERLALLAATAKGRARWAHPPAFGDGDAEMSPVIGPDRKLALPNGTRLRVVDPATGRGMAIQLGTDVAYLVANEKVLWALVRAPGLDASRGRLLAIDHAGKVVEMLDAPALASAMSFLTGDGIVYAVTQDGRLVAIESRWATNLAGPWPTPGGDAANDRRLR